MKDTLLSLPTISEHHGEGESYRILDVKLKELTERRKQLSSDDDKKEMRLFQETLLPLLHESPFLKYVFDKPRGYAGDYLTQEMIWLAYKEGGDHRYLGRTELGKLLSSHSFNMENTRANIVRLKFLKKKVRQAGKRVASIGCGSCIELWDAGRKFIQSRDFFLLDMDEEALRRAREKIPGNGTETITFMKENILKFIAINKQKNLLGQRDLIYSIGMIDYFAVKSAKKIIKALWENVAPGGSLIFSNADPDNPTRLWMEYVGDWFLCYKEEKDMRDIVSDLDHVASVTHTMDRFNVYHYIEVIKI